jgi:hypothetical protein
MQKGTLNIINRYYIKYIKKCIKSKLFRKYDMEKNICECEIVGENVDFYITYSKDNTLDYGYLISGLYYPTKNKIEIVLKVANDFGLEYLDVLNYMLKSYLIHEIEHHLQNCKVPFRELLPIENYESNLEYIMSKSELEAFTKSLYYIHKKTKQPFREILTLESEAISTNKRHQRIFRQEIYNFIRRRKDLNIFKNIKL